MIYSLWSHILCKFPDSYRLYTRTRWHCLISRSRYSLLGWLKMLSMKPTSNGICWRPMICWIENGSINSTNFISLTQTISESHSQRQRPFLCAQDQLQFSSVISLLVEQKWWWSIYGNYTKCMANDMWFLVYSYHKMSTLWRYRGDCRNWKVIGLCIT